MKRFLLFASLVAVPQLGYAAEGTICGKITKISVSLETGDHLTVVAKDGTLMNLAIVNNPDILSVAQTAFNDAIAACVTWTDNNGQDAQYVSEISISNP